MAFNNAVNASQPGVQTISSLGGWTGSTFSQYTTLVGGATNNLVGISPSATSGVALISQGSAANPVYGTVVVAGGGTGLTTLTAHAVLVGEGTSNVGLVGPGSTSGVALISQGASADPVFGTVVVAGGGTGLATLTAHALVVGNGTSNVSLVGPGATSGIPLIAQGVGSDPAFGTAVVAGGGTGATSFTAYSVICGGTTSTGALQNVSGVGTAGQVLTSNGAAALPSWQSPSITYSWTDEAASFSAVAGNGYFVSAAATATLPASPSQGNTVEFIVDGAVDLTIKASGSQLIQLGNLQSSAGGTLDSTASGDAITLVYRAADTTWFASSSVGNWSIA